MLPSSNVAQTEAIFVFIVFLLFVVRLFVEFHLYNEGWLHPITKCEMDDCDLLKQALSLVCG